MDRDTQYAGKDKSINISIINPERQGIPGICDNNISMGLKQKCYRSVD
jgi:hypothetical protein